MGKAKSVGKLWSWNLVSMIISLIKPVTKKRPDFDPFDGTLRE